MTKSPQFSQAIRSWMDVFMHRSMRGWGLFAKSTGLSMPQFSVMMQLHHRGNCAIGDISERFDITNAAASQLVDKLVQSGFIKREEDPQDRRAKMLNLTDKGRELIQRGIGERRAMSIGLLAFALLIPLALTSTNGWQKRLGRRWKLLHRLVYFAVPLSILHYFWLERDIKDWVFVYLAVVAILFAIRIPAIRRTVARKRQSPQMVANQTKTEMDS